jgi:hypothetical protein
MRFVAGLYDNRGQRQYYLLSTWIMVYPIGKNAMHKLQRPVSLLAPKKNVGRVVSRVQAGGTVKKKRFKTQPIARRMPPVTVEGIDAMRKAIAQMGVDLSQVAQNVGAAYAAGVRGKIADVE